MQPKHKQNEQTPTQPLIRDIKLIQRYSRSNLTDDLRFREHIISRLNMSGAAADAVVEDVTNEVWSQIDCVSCANCCKTLAIVVDMQDIQRIAKRLKTSPAEFKKNHCVIQPDKTITFKASPCTFLATDGRCTIYEDRPKACHDFPYLRDKGFAKRTITMIENCSCCPIVFNVWQQLKYKFGYRKAAKAQPAPATGPKK